MPSKGPEKEKNQHIQVAVRLRPLNATERKQGSYSIVDIDNVHKSVSVKSSLNQFANNQKIFSYDNVFGPQTKQVEVYKTIVAPTLNEVLMGYNCTIFAYGQTGSGKTFTMEGERTEDASVSWEEDPLAGIIPRTLHHLFSRLQKQECEFSVRISFLEIYNEELIDLLGADSVENPRLKIYEDSSKKGSCVIQGLEEVVVHNRDEVYSILERGTNKRQTASTLLNAHSSRSHSVFMITVHIKENTVDGEELLKTGKLNLVDLAGSENIGRSGAVEKRAREAGNINQSLLTLGRVITALVEHAPHIPYRESKLTRLLQDSLGGRTKTSIIATISPASVNLEETVSTLEYAHRAKSITNKPEINQKLTKKALIKEYTEEIERLRRDLQANRDKNGIFVAKENYDKMLETDTKQKGFIRDLEEQIDFVKNELIKVNELFSDTKLELKEKTEDLEATTKTLEETTDTLHVTKKHLRKTKQERDEQAHLVSEHVKHEKVLFGQATQLLDVTKEATCDNFGLFDKVDRLKNLENANVSVQETFRQQFRDAIDSMQANRGELTKNHTEINRAVQENLGEIKSKQMAQVKEHIEQVSNIRQQLDGGFTAFLDLQRAHYQAAQSQQDELNSRLKTLQETSKERSDKFRSDVLSTYLTELQTTVSCCKQESQLHHQETIRTIERLRQYVSEMQDKAQECILREIERNRNHESQMKAQYSAQLEAVRASIKQQEQKELERNESMVEKLRAMLNEASQQSNLLRAQHLTMAETHTEENQTVTTARTEQTHSELEQLRSEIKSTTNNVNKTCMENSERLTANQQQIEDKLCELDRNQEKLGSECSNHSNAAVEAMSLFCEETEAFSIEIKSTYESNLQCRVTSIQEMKSQHTEGVQQLTTMLNTDVENTCTDIESERASLAENCNMFSDWSQGLSSALEARDQDVEKLLTEDLATYMPTGKTPQRHDYTYPQGLKKASRHSTLLSQFRKDYVLDEAMNTPIPDLSFTESENGEGSTVGEEPVKSLSGSVDALNLSGDSAISTASTVSTTVSDIADKSNKENKMLPPPGRAPKTAKPHSRSNSQQSTKSTKRDRSNSSTRSTGENTPGKIPTSKYVKDLGKRSTPTTKTKLPLRSSNTSAS